MLLDSNAHAKANGLPGVAIDPVGLRWSGFYVGLHGGYGRAEQDSAAFNANRVVQTCETGPNSGIPTACSSGDFEGGFIGLQLGYNFLVTPNVLIGVEFDSSAAGLDGRSSNCTATGCGHADVETDY